MTNATALTFREISDAALDREIASAAAWADRGAEWARFRLDTARREAARRAAAGVVAP